ncbi:hypothetical protein NBRC10512_006927 [Rhodotorula toruloides]|uniref:RHTO0S02e12112g1_1 n=2 Tax=Rhodotorula toruloides TaxID=5286 RepID=A0A061AI04_RHOTO|nr:priA protein precursor [Rhodotorula toruloides NP11]EMS23509.1 priA protein precursor [Rhodotorula toruloides NP11]CDR37215.1 RHTO0S02e12112g1_1 [Rhodotorula toruloides]
MLARLHLLALLSALAFLSTTASAAALLEQPSNSTSPAFQLNLARRFSSTVAQLKSRRGGSDKRSKVGLEGPRKRTVSDELIALIKAAGAPFMAGASAHAAAGARPSSTWAAEGQGQSYGPSQWATATAAAQPWSSMGPSQLAHAASAGQYGPSQTWNAPAATTTCAPESASSHHAQPSATWAAAPTGASQAAAAAGTGNAAPQPSALWDGTGKAAKMMEYVKRRIEQEPWEILDSRLLCPFGETACPIFPRGGTWECVDTKTELQSCGGCTSKGQGEDCTLIKGAQGVTCESGRCTVYTCASGYELDTAFKRPGGGSGRCKKAKKSKRA